jgi:hypothetical protein
MPVSDVSNAANLQIKSSVREKTDPDGFSKVLRNTIPKEESASSKPVSTENPGAQNSGQAGLIELGRISKETPTVSHILKSHPEYSDKCWKIVFAEENQGKPFTKMHDGTVVALNPDNNELLWGRELSTAAARANTGDAINTAQDKEPADKPILIGTLSRDKPTVSHLLQSNPDFDGSFWNIINAPVNSGKKFTSLRPGTQVSLDPVTKEISFANASSVKSNRQAAAARSEQPASGEKTSHLSLADAVRPYIGTPYKKIDCYALVIKGLTEQGIQYRGNNGLREKLKNLARHDGLRSNAYLNGEGLVEKAGNKLFSKSMRRVSNVGANTEKIYSGMTPHLREGLILSFSTPTKGHTGIVSRQGDDWTYINSGVIDNQISPGDVTERVGEEFLKAEIKNWFLLASERKEPLTVTLGELDVNRL